MTSIRPATMHDVEDIARIHVESWRETYRGIVPDDVLDDLSVERRLAQWQRTLATSDDTAHRVLVADVDDHMVGFASYGLERESDPIYRGELSAIYILRSAHRMGLGRGLVSAAAQGLLELGTSSMLVWVLEKNPARGFYEHLGGLYVREKPIEIGQAALSEVAYGWKDLRMLASNSARQTA